jgi:hypothetical protein
VTGFGFDWSLLSRLFSKALLARVTGVTGKLAIFHFLRQSRRSLPVVPELDIH